MTVTRTKAIVASYLAMFTRKDTHSQRSEANLAIDGSTEGVSHSMYCLCAEATATYESGACALA
jgi:hypothetical protein